MIGAREEFNAGLLAYLRDVLTRLPALTNRFDLDALTPVNWKPA